MRIVINRLIRNLACEPKTKSRFWCEEKFKNIDSDQIEGAEFEFLGLEIRFERNKSFDFRSTILISDSRTEFWIQDQNFKFWQSHVLYFEYNFAQNSSKTWLYTQNFSRISRLNRKFQEFFFNLASAPVELAETAPARC
jgi:hypothetical protein